MAKFRSPFNTNELWITQTYHSGSNNTAIDISATADTPVYALADGKILVTSPIYGSYCTTSVNNSDLKLFFVHTHKWLPVGTNFKQGQVICYVAPKNLNGGYPTHLHLGLQTGKYIIDYLDRSIIFKTAYPDIKAMWFIGENFDWSKHRDLSYENTYMFKKGDRIQFIGVQNARKAPAGEITGDSVIGQTGVIYDNPREAILDGVNYTWYDIHIDGGGSGWFADVGKFKLYEEPATPPVTPPNAPDCSEYVKHIETLQAENTQLKEELGTCKEQLEAKVEEISNLEEQIKAFDSLIEEINKNVDDLQKKYDTLYIEKNRIENEKNKAIEGYNSLKNGRFMWIVEFLEKLFPKRE
jgi:hypothetical protein